MFRDWMPPDELPIFHAAVRTRTPHARPGAAKDEVALLGWQTLDRVLGSPVPADVLTVARGRLVTAPRPRSAKDVQRLFRSEARVSTVVRGSERHDDGLAALTRSFAESFPGEAHAQLYATPRGTYSYAWHYDLEDVFIVQTLGVKEYYFRDNTAARHTRLGDTLDFSLIRFETSQLMGTRLHAGDWLYIPRRYWHLVVSHEDSLSISIGIMPPDELARARRLPAGWTGLAKPAGR